MDPHRIPLEQWLLVGVWRTGIICLAEAVAGSVVWITFIRDHRGPFRAKLQRVFSKSMVQEPWLHSSFLSQTQNPGGAPGAFCLCTDVGDALEES